MNRKKILCGCRQGYINCDKETVTVILERAYEEACKMIKKKTRRERFRNLVDGFIAKVDPDLIEELAVFNSGLQINVKTRKLPVVIAWYPSTGIFVYGSKRYVGSIDDMVEIIKNPPETLVALYGQEAIL